MTDSVYEFGKTNLSNCKVPVFLDLGRISLFITGMFYFERLQTTVVSGKGFVLHIH